MDFRYSKPTENNLSSSEDMLAISQEIHANFVVDNRLKTPELVIFPVDPLHLHAYWNIDEHSINDSNRLVLRIFWHPNGSDNIEQSKLWFDQVLDDHQGQTNIQLPIDGTRYSAVLGNRDRQHSLEILLRSNTICVPNTNAKTLINQPTATTTPSFELTPKQHNQVRMVITHSLYNEDAINTKIRDSVLRRHKPSPCSKLFYSQPESPRLTTVTNTNFFDETLIDIIIQQNLAGKGREFRLNAKTTTEANAHFAASNASGQNNRI
jgi:hypothetical protein